MWNVWLIFIYSIGNGIWWEVVYTYMSNVLPGRVVPCVHWYTSACSSIVISPPPKYVTCWFYKRPFTLLHEPLHWCKSEWPSPTLLLQFAWVFVLMPRWQNSAGLSLAQSASVKWTLNRVIILGSSSPGKTNVCTRMIRNRPGYFAHAQSVSIRPSRREGPDDRLRWEGLNNEKWRIVSVRVRYPGPSTLPCLKSRARIPNDHYRAVHQAER